MRQNLPDIGSDCNNFREPLKIHFGGQANLFDSGQRQGKAALASAKADFPSLPEYKNILLTAQKQLLELPFRCWFFCLFACLILGIGYILRYV